MLAPEPYQVADPAEVYAALAQNTQFLDVIFEAGLRREARLAAEAEAAAQAAS